LGDGSCDGRRFEAFSQIRKSNGRASILRYVGKFSRENEVVFGMGIVAVQDRSHAVRHYGCALLAYSLRDDGKRHLMTAMDAYALVSILTLLGHVEAQPSPIGIVLLIFAAVVMPWLAKQKRELSVTTASAALRADAAESAVCGYLALIALAGLVITVIWRVSWADPVAALALLPLIPYSAGGMGGNEGQAMLSRRLSGVLVATLLR
jgi:hypothetical protein